MLALVQRLKLHHEIQIAAHRVEPASRRRAEQIELTDVEPPTQRFEFVPLLLDQGDHRSPPTTRWYTASYCGTILSTGNWSKARCCAAAPILRRRSGSRNKPMAWSAMAATSPTGAR